MRVAVSLFASRCLFELSAERAAVSFLGSFDNDSSLLRLADSRAYQPSLASRNGNTLFRVSMNGLRWDAQTCRVLSGSNKFTRALS